MKTWTLGIALVWLSSSFAGAESPMTDRQLTHQIHGKIVEDPTLPYCAHVVRVDVEQGVVTLKGHVYTQEQKAKIEEKAAAIAGEENVKSDIILKQQS